MGPFLIYIADFSARPNIYLELRGGRILFGKWTAGSFGPDCARIVLMPCCANKAHSYYGENMSAMHLLIFLLLIAIWWITFPNERDRWEILEGMYFGPMERAPRKSA